MIFEKEDKDDLIQLLCFVMTSHKNNSSIQVDTHKPLAIKTDYYVIDTCVMGDLRDLINSNNVTIKKDTVYVQVDPDFICEDILKSLMTIYLSKGDESQKLIIDYDINSSQFIFDRKLFYFLKKYKIIDRSIKYSLEYEKSRLDFQMALHDIFAQSIKDKHYNSNE